ncbi:MAG: hypothetical protein WBC91_06720 [Phototrophicaceae bacterium]
MSILPTNQPNNRFFFLHPDFAYKSLYISDLMTHYPIAYVKMYDQINTSQQALDWIDTSRQSISSTHNKQTVLILDEIDHLPPLIIADICLHFMNCHEILILMIPRTLPDIAQFSNVLKQSLQIIIPTYPTTHTSSQHILNASGFGIGRATINACPIHFTPNEMIHDLFFYILEHKVVTRDQLLNQFWGHLDKQAAITNFHVTRQKLDERIGIQFLTSQTGYYQINPEIHINYDVDTYRAIMRDLVYNNADDVQYEQYQNAYDLYRATYLFNTSASWTMPIRDSLSLMQADVCYQLALMHPPTLDSIGLLSQAFRLNPYREDITHAMMTIYLAANLPCDAVIVYESLAENLQNRGEITPSDTLAELMKVAQKKCNS